MGIRVPQHTVTTGTGVPWLCKAPGVTETQQRQSQLLIRGVLWPGGELGEEEVRIRGENLLGEELERQTSSL